MRNKVSNTQDKLWLFHLYLLSTMRVESNVLKEALEQLHASEKDMATARESISALGFGTIRETANLYREVLGVPLAVEPIDDTTIPATFHGSWSLSFKLPLWAEFDFIINEHPDGQTWDPAFKRSHAEQPLPLATVADLKPWKFVKEEVTNRFGTPQFGDAWEYWEELYYMIPSSPGGPLHRCFLIFDYSLLQSFEISG